MANPKNQVLDDEYKSSANFFESDQILKEYLKIHLPKYQKSEEKLHQQGKISAQYMDPLAMRADENPPELKKRNRFGEDVNEVEFDLAYWELMDIAAASEMFYIKYHPEVGEQYVGHRHRLSFAIGQLYAMSELGQYCPHCMTDGAALLIERYGSDDDRERLLPRLGAREGKRLYSGAMFITEKSGGSDVGANLCTAEQGDGNLYKLNGEKWFCSNVNADVIMTLARTGPVDKGTRGLSLFLVERNLPDGERNPMEIVRLKDKLGVKSMATGEVILDDTRGKRIGEEGEGFKLMTDMINMSRNYNSIAAVAGFRRALIESWQYLNHRKAFGIKAVQHALIREKFLELGSKYLATFLLAWRGLEAMDATEEGNEKEGELLRMLTPMAKWESAEQSVYAVRECMELMGGNGYIEDFVMPRLLRDINVLPIWEGSGNIIVLDMLRAARKSDGLQIVFDMIASAADSKNVHADKLGKRLENVREIWQQIAETDDRDRVEATAKPLFREIIQMLQIALLMKENNRSASDRYQTAVDYLIREMVGGLEMHDAASLEEIEELIGWKY